MAQLPVPVWLVIGFVSGSIPFSLWLGRLFLRADIRRYGDGNPGATNAWLAGGWPVGLLALALDYAKAALPVGLAHFGAGASGWGLVAVALAPAVGHAFSPFLKFRGGKALAATFGLWSGLTLGEGPMILGLLLALFFLIQRNSGWAVLMGMLAFAGHLLLRQADLYLLAIWLGNTLLLAWKYRADLQMGMEVRPLVQHSLRWIVG